MKKVISDLDRSSQYSVDRQFILIWRIWEYDDSFHIFVAVIKHNLVTKFMA